MLPPFYFLLFSLDRFYKINSIFARNFLQKIDSKLVKIFPLKILLACLSCVNLAVHYLIYLFISAF